MPTLDWLNREAAFNTAARVPYRLLEAVSVHGDAAANNLLIQGDNLEALESLLLLYRGQVKWAALRERTPAAAGRVSGGLHLPMQA